MSDLQVTLRSVSAAFTVNGVTNTPAIIPAANWFNASSLGRDATATTRRQPTAAGPFTFVSTLEYTDQFGDSNTVTSTVTCTE